MESAYQKCVKSFKHKKSTLQKGASITNYILKMVGVTGIEPVTPTV